MVREHQPLVWWPYLRGYKDYTIPRTPCGPVACGLSLVVYMKVHTGFIVFVGGLYNLLQHPPVVLWPVV